MCNTIKQMDRMRDRDVLKLNRAHHVAFHETVLLSGISSNTSLASLTYHPPLIFVVPDTTSLFDIPPNTFVSSTRTQKLKVHIYLVKKDQSPQINRKSLNHWFPSITYQRHVHPSSFLAKCQVSLSIDYKTT